MFLFPKLALLIFSRTTLGVTPVRGTPPVQLSDSFEVLAMVGDENFQGCGGTAKFHCVSDICGQGKFSQICRADSTRRSMLSGAHPLLWPNLLLGRRRLLPGPSTFLLVLRSVREWSLEIDT